MWVADNIFIPLGLPWLPLINLYSELSTLPVTCTLFLSIITQLQ